MLEQQEYDLSYETEYVYERPVACSRTYLRIFPREDMGAHLAGESLQIEPDHTSKDEYRDRYGNRVAVLHVSNFHDRLRVRYRAKVVIRIDRPPLTRKQIRTRTLIRPSKYVAPDDVSRNIARSLKTPDAVIPWIHGQFRYMPGETQVETSSEKALRMRRGVCQDYSHAALALYRSMNVPCLYVGGFQAFGNFSHAWIAWLNGNNYVEWDGTTGQPANLIGYLPTAVGRDYHDVAPVRGVFRGTARSRHTTRVELVPLQTP